ncbi:hypothetical protein EZJ49_15205 [Bdellovibrio bacteriovorus]|uniref:hypothetical protein n=1 Tax=Bdellovibrio bacteriovorus TaxID=959 RepID=UPI0021D32A82|nr:hypothetical protein [Bdellovibrio bacteriovorus]UXR64416.1 hypothetical protein EZJ49_15205 [Bdellovibrio bacteriovorus]
MNYSIERQVALSYPDCMLINCPRCGFQQPEDKYCAQCGVDMESFKPATPPAWKRFIGNPLIQLSLVVVVAGGVGITLYQKGQQNLERRVQYLKSTVQINSTSGVTDLPEALPVAEASSESTSQSSEAADGVVDAYKVEPPPATAALAVAATPGASPTPSPTARTGAHLIVYYAEVPRGRLNTIFTVSRSTGQFMNFNEYTAGILPDFKKNVLDHSDIVILHKEDRTLSASRTLQWSYAAKNRMNPSMEIGLTTFFELSDLENNSLRGNLEIQRNWLEPSPSGTLELQRKSFPAIFEIGGETGFFMSGVLPPGPGIDRPIEDDLMNFEIYKILRSPRFRAGQSEFVIFVDFEKGN